MNPYDTEELPPPQDTDEEHTFLPPLTPPPAGTIRFIDVHVYDQPVEEEEDLQSVESTLTNDQDTPNTQDSIQQQPSIPSRTRWEIPLLPGVLATVSLALIASILAVVLILPLFAPSATIMIIPVSQEVSTMTTITVTSGVSSSPGILTGRALPSITMSQAKTVPTTGMTHQDAQAAHGLVVFYNAAPYAQTVVAGTVLTGASGIQVVTDQDAIIPAGNLATNGQATVSAHAATTGPAGNLPAGNIYGQCCRVDVLVSNTTFTGGQAARDYHTVTKQDITGAVAVLSTSLQQSVQAALQTQVQPSETLVTPLSCSQTVTPAHSAGSEATTERVTLSETCAGMTYPTQAYQHMTTTILTQQAYKQLGDGYILTGSSQGTITGATTKNGTLLLHVRLTGTYAYQLSPQQARLKALVAGKRKQEATAALLALPGIQSVSITTENGDRLPTDTARTQVVMVVMP